MAARWVALGYLVTFGTLAGYAGWLVYRLRVLRHRLRSEK